MTDLLTARIRRGRRNPQALYAQLGDEPADTDPSIGWAKSADDARAACDAVNNDDRQPGSRWWTSAGLIYTRHGATLGDWVISIGSPELARRIVKAVNGGALFAWWMS